MGDDDSNVPSNVLNQLHQLEKTMMQHDESNDATKDKPTKQNEEPLHDPAEPNNIAAPTKALTKTLMVMALRMVSFLGTQWTLRRLHSRPQILGQSSIQLELLLTSILFLSREGFRLALTRIVTPDNAGLIWASVPLTAVLAACAAVYHWYSTTDNDVDLAYAGLLYCLAALLEGLGEPPVLMAMRNIRVTEKAAAETLAGLGKTICIGLLEPTIINFGIAQCLYACIYTSFLYFACRHVHWPKYAWHGPTVKLAFMFNLQGVFKHLLTQGDRIVLTLVANDYDQGVYAMGSAYGGLAARLLLQPMEESARLVFSRVGNDLETVYTSFVKLVLYIGLVFSCLAVNYTQLLLQVLAGWGDNSEAVATLSAFCVYTAALAWNGMTEACMYGIAKTGADLRNIGIAHTIIGIVFVALAPIAVTNGGTVALVWANTVAMVARALFAIYFVAGSMLDSTKRSRLSISARLFSKMMPSPLSIGCFLLSFLATSNSQQELDIENGTSAMLRSAMKHVGIGVACGIGALSVAFTVETELRHNLRRFSSQKTD